MKHKVMDNILIQISGRKRVILWPPGDVDFMYMIGDKSLVTDVDSPDLEKFPLFAKAKRFECDLNPGEGIFIPGNRLCFSCPTNHIIKIN